MHNMNTGNEERVLVLAPTAGDATLSQSLLTDAGLACHVSTTLCGLCRDFAEGAGALLLTEEVLAASDSNCLVEAIQQQPAWSDVPILLLCDAGADSPVAIWSMELLGNVTVLERPVRVTTLVSALRTALKARRRQYELRNQVEAVRSSEERLRLFSNTPPSPSPCSTGRCVTSPSATAG
jgi:DNA-binding NtrC family response regulator